MTAPSAPARPLRVASVPAGHPYVAAVIDPARADLLPDPRHPGAPAHRWWPPIALTPEWIRRHAGEIDLLHLHFGAESYDVEHLRRVVEELASSGVPLVYTAHDLQNPQLADQAEHERMLDVVIPAASALITLTPTAAEEIRRRWGREARVIPHPRLRPDPADPDAAGPDPAGTTPPRVTVHLRDLRPNVDGPGTLRGLAEAARLLRAAGAPISVEAHLNESVRDAGAAAEIRRIAASAPDVALLVHARLDDAELDAELGSAAAMVLPYSHGTHSGWVELCYDLGVPVVGPAAGHFGAQHPEDYSTADPRDGAALARALAGALARPGALPGTEARRERVRRRAVERAGQLRAVRAEHAELYAGVARAGAAR